MDNNLKNDRNNEQRYNLIDSLRGFAIINMVAFHLLYDIFEVYGLSQGWFSRPLTIAWERFICISFILISGISVNFSHHTLKRGIIVNLCGFAVTVVTVLAMPSQAIWFGVLNLIGCGMIFCHFLRGAFDKYNSFAGFFVSLVLYAITYGIPSGYAGFFGLRLIEMPEVLYQFKPLAFLGFPSADFISADYFPLIPWIFLFVAGYFAWKCVIRLKIENIFRIKIPVLNIIGKYSLWIYLAHQPVLMGICMVVFR